MPPITVATPRSSNGRPLSVQSDDGGHLVHQGLSVPADLSDLVEVPFIHATHGFDLRQNGAVTSVIFAYVADEEQDVRVHEVRLVMSARQIHTDGSSFGPIPALGNGLSISMVNQFAVGGPAEYTVPWVFTQTEDFFGLGQCGFIDRSDTKSDSLIARILLAGTLVLRAGTRDRVEIAVQDDLTDSRLLYLRAWLFGIKENV